MDKDLDRAIGRKIKLRRQLCGYTRMDLANKLRVSSQQIQKYEAGVSALKSEKILQMATILEVSPDWFFHEKMINVPGNHPIADLMNSEEVAELVINYLRLNQEAKTQLRGFLASVTKTNSITKAKYKILED